MIKNNKIGKLSEGFKGEITVRLSDNIFQNYINHFSFKNLYISSIGYYPNARLHYYERSKECSTYYIILYCIDGSGYCTINGRKHKIDTNEYIIIPTNSNHSYGSSIDEPWTIYWAHFNGESTSILQKIISKPQIISPDLNSRIKDRIAILDEIISLLTNDLSFEALEYSNSCFTHFIYTLLHVDKFRVKSTKPTSNLTVSYKAIHYMRESIERNISIDELAKYCGYSKGRFITIFKQEVGESPIHYFNRLKIELACQYIRQTTIKTEQLCNKIGITNPLYFSRLFKQYMYMSPSEYKKGVK